MPMSALVLTENFTCSTHKACSVPPPTLWKLYWSSKSWTKSPGFANLATIPSVENTLAQRKSKGEILTKKSTALALILDSCSSPLGKKWRGKKEHRQCWGKVQFPLFKSIPLLCWQCWTKSILVNYFNNESNIVQESLRIKDPELDIRGWGFFCFTEVVSLHKSAYHPLNKSAHIMQRKESVLQYLCNLFFHHLNTS